MKYALALIFLEVAVSWTTWRPHVVPRLSRAVGSACVAWSALTGVYVPGGTGTGTAAAWAADEWTDRNRLAAEAWRAVDEIYYDRTFSGKDWFKLRQDAVKRTYRADEDVYAGIASMLATLGDKYTRYLPPAKYDALVNSAQGQLTGVGLELLGRDDGTVIVNNIEEESPARLSGIERGDVLVDIDGTSTSGLSPEEVAVLIRGEKDTKASIRLSRAGKAMDFEVIRKPFKLKGVLSTVATVKGQNVGVITVKSFSSTTKDEVTRALEDMHRKDVGVLVLDMRNNGGGLLQGAVETASLLIPPGKIVVFVVGKDGAQEAKQTLPGDIDSGDTLLPDLKTPLYVLVNGNTASAAEVLSAALKENGRAKLVGEKTFGKGVIQTLEPLSKGGIAVTIAKYETPLHHDINKVGIPVDVAVACDPSNKAEECAASFL